MASREMMDYLAGKTRELLDTPSRSEEVAEAARAWLGAAGTEKEAEETKRYIAILEENLEMVDDLISLVESEKGLGMFGAEVAKGLASHGKKIKAEGAKYCDCPACEVVAQILEKKELLLS